MDGCLHWSGRHFHWRRLLSVHDVVESANWSRERDFPFQQQRAWNGILQNTPLKNRHWWPSSWRKNHRQWDHHGCHGWCPSRKNLHQILYDDVAIKPVCPTATCFFTQKQTVSSLLSRKLSQRDSANNTVRVGRTITHLICCDEGISQRYYSTNVRKNWHCLTPPVRAVERSPPLG